MCQQLFLLADLSFALIIAFSEKICNKTKAGFLNIFHELHSLLNDMIEIVFIPNVKRNILNFIKINIRSNNKMLVLNTLNCIRRGKTV